MAKGIKGSSPKIEEKPTRTSFNIVPRISTKLGIIAIHRKTDKSAILNELLQEYIDKYEKKNGEIKI